MRRPAVPTLLIAAIAVVGISAGPVAATAADDQAAADAAMAAFSERMVAAGGVSDGPTDMSIDDEAETDPDDPFTGCFGDIAGLEARGRLAGETARAFSDDFSFPGEGAPAATDPLSMTIASDDTIMGAVITVDDDSAGVIDEVVRAFGSEEAAMCLEGLFNEMAAGAVSDASSPGEAGFTVDVAAEADLGIGDASASLQLALASDIGGTTTASNVAVYLARADRSLIVLTITTDADPTVDIDGPGELAAIVDSL